MGSARAPQSSPPVAWGEFLLSQLFLGAVVVLHRLWEIHPFLPLPGYGGNIFETIAFHGPLALVANWPALTRLRASRGRFPRLAAFLAIFPAIGLDADHFLAAGTFEFLKVMNTDTPITHSLAFAGMLAAFVGALSERRYHAWLVGNGLLTHLGLDLTDSPIPLMPYLWPFPSPYAPPWVGFAVIEMSLILTWFLSRSSLLRIPPLSSGVWPSAHHPGPRPAPPSA
ncbi:MAG: hypothetical protein HYY13_09290 [Nitrospirae bacterium]|nr:hypothetical protein [Nitrospirota bacterium]